MGKYTKTYSNYIHRKLHQQTNDGNIYERDWGTLGERHVIESGKRKIYADSNFLFTDSNLRGTKKRNNTGEWSQPYTSDDLTFRVNDEVNNISNISESNDIRHYAYYGSALELLRSTVENIIKWFPARFWATGDGVVRQTINGFEYLNSVTSDGNHNYTMEYVDTMSITPDNPVRMFLISNPFDIDFFKKNVTLTKTDNSLRNMVLSWDSYFVNGTPLLSWDVWIKPYDICDADYTVVYEITFKYNGDCSVSDGGVCTGRIYGLKVKDTVVWCTDVKGLVIQPSNAVIEHYFDNLGGLESTLLSRKSNPRYTAKFITPIDMPNNIPGYYYTERSYTWPSNGYCINVDDISYVNYVNDLYRLGSLLDNTWCDNLWRNMTHESVKNFDYTYESELIDGEKVEDITGGTRMEHMLRIWGRSYDDLKRYIDAISLKNVVTYNNFGNVGNAELSDKAELRGWEVYSTKLNDNDNLYLTNEFIGTIGKLGDRWGGASASVVHGKWFNTLNPTQVSQNNVDVNFTKKLILNSGGIFASKGTKQSIEQVLALFGFGYNEFEIEERSYSVIPKRRDDIYYHYVENRKLDSDADYRVVEECSTIDEFINMKKTFDENSPAHIEIGSRRYDLVKDMTYGDFCKQYNDKKNLVFNYDDEYSGIPLKTLYINNDYYIVPYFTQDKIYDGDVQFESDGAWGKTIQGNSVVMDKAGERYNYMETLPYMEVVQNVSGLTGVNAYTIGDKTIYYVMDLSDLTDYTETIPPSTSNFFKLIDSVNPQLFSSWKNVPLNTGNLDRDAYEQMCEQSDLTSGCDYDDYLLCQYYDSIVLDNLGNNPHVGYASYDIGSKYLEYIKMPFKYAAEHYGFQDTVDCDTVSRFRFDVTEIDYKIVDRTQPESNIDEYYLPSKLLVLKNKMRMLKESEVYFKTYFKNVILKYLTQVIPSTSLLVLVNATVTEN